MVENIEITCNSFKKTCLCTHQNFLIYGDGILLPSLNSIV